MTSGKYCSELAPSVAVIVTEALVETGCVVIVKFAFVAPAGMVTLAGTLATVLSLVSVTTAPPAGATLLEVTVPVEVRPPSITSGLI